MRSSVSLKPTAPVRNTAIPDKATPPTRTNSAPTSVSADTDSGSDSSESSDSDEDASDPGGNVNAVCHARVAMGI